MSNTMFSFFIRQRTSNSGKSFLKSNGCKNQPRFILWAVCCGLFTLTTTSVAQQSDKKAPVGTQPGNQVPAKQPDDEEDVIIDDEPPPPPPGGSNSSNANGKPATGKKDEPYQLNTMTILGTNEEIGRLTGSAYVVKKKDLDKFKDDNVERTLMRIPGVYIRGEDGYGLRPNIGMRGGNSDRSKKITLLEDGILFGPAPYSAPAAYYFPFMTRMVGVEVFKGPVAIQHGPNTIGGALNLLTRGIPNKAGGGVDFAIGQNAYVKTMGHYGMSTKYAGFMVEGARLRTDGFKNLDGGGNTGFGRNEFMMKGRINTDPGAETYHELLIKVGYSTEISNETYLGLTDADFNATPYRRYRGSALDQMRWQRGQLEINYILNVNDKFVLRTTAYHHRFIRAWRKFNEFPGGPAINDVLMNPTSGRQAVYYGVLSGTRDSASNAEALGIGINDRRFVSQGIQSTGQWDIGGKIIKQKFKFGARFHYDKIERLHTQDSYLMNQGNLVLSGLPRVTTTRNYADSHALAFHVVDELAYKNLLLTPGVRTELIYQSYENYITGDTQTGTQQVLLPGVGAFLGLTKDIGALAGVYQGFSPLAPGQAENVNPEKSVNYELGARLQREKTRAEVVGFYNDYSNLTGECTFSNGCTEQQLGKQFNGGRVQLFGLEASGAHEFHLTNTIALPVQASYTFTKSKFKTSFSSENPQFGDVEQGDELPYVPNHQGNVTVGLASPRAGINASAILVGKMRNIAGQGEIPDNQLIKSYMIFDSLAYVNLFREGQLYVKMDNIFNSPYMVSRQPFGARPGRGRWVQIGFKVEMLATKLSRMIEKLMPQPSKDHFNRHLVVSSSWNNHIRPAFGRFHKLHMHRTNGIEILVAYGNQTSATFLDIAFQTAKHAHIGVGIHKYFDIKLIAQLRFNEYQNTFHDNEWRWRYQFPTGQATVGFEIVKRNFHRFSALECGQLPYQQLRFQ
jgi:Fe(3+) dicitrate transport protein